MHNITILYDCPPEVSVVGNNFTCQDHGSVNQNGFYYDDDLEDEVLKQYPGLQKCGRRIQVPNEGVSGWWR